MQLHEGVGIFAIVMPKPKGRPRKQVMQSVPPCTRVLLPDSLEGATCNPTSAAGFAQEFAGFPAKIHHGVFRSECWNARLQCWPEDIPPCPPSCTQGFSKDLSWGGLLLHHLLSQQEARHICVPVEKRFNWRGVFPSGKQTRRRLPVMGQLDP